MELLPIPQNEYQRLSWISLRLKTSIIFHLKPGRGSELLNNSPVFRDICDHCVTIEFGFRLQKLSNRTYRTQSYR